jgi:hypothetical protein
MDKNTMRLLHDLLVAYELHAIGPRGPGQRYDDPRAQAARELQEMIEEEMKNTRT